MSLTEASAARIEAVLDSSARPDAPGVASIIILDGQVVHRSCRGLADLEYGVPITTDTTFHVASMSKQFAGFALAMAADRGLLDLDGDIREHLPYVPDLGVPITARQLAHHTSGLRDQWGMLVLSGWRMDDVITTDDVIESVRRTQALNFPPQTGFSYSNTGYTLIGELVRAVDGRSLREFCAQELFAPLGMTDTHFHDDYREVVPGRSYSYNPAPAGGFQHAVLSYSLVGATSLHTTVEDLARWDQNFTDHKVGLDAVFALMRDSGILNDGTLTGYAFGQMQDQHRGQTRVHHSGGDAGFRSQGERFPELGLSVYVLSNAGDTDVLSIARAISDVVLDQLGIKATPTAHTAAPDPDRYAGHYVDPDTGSQVQLIDDQGTLKINGLPVTLNEPNVLTVGPLTLRFPDGDAPAPTVQLLMTAMAPQRAVRVEPMTVSPDNLADYVGSYRSDELDATYLMHLSDAVLVMTHRKLGPVPLTASLPDRFSGATPTGMAVAIAFDRDDNGRVTSLRINMPRLNNVQLERIG